MALGTAPGPQWHPCMLVGCMPVQAPPARPASSPLVSAGGQSPCRLAHAASQYHPRHPTCRIHPPMHLACCREPGRASPALLSEPLAAPSQPSPSLPSHSKGGRKASKGCQAALAPPAHPFLPHLCHLRAAAPHPIRKASEAGESITACRPLVFPCCLQCCLPAFCPHPAGRPARAASSASSTAARRAGAGASPSPRARSERPQQNARGL